MHKTQEQTKTVAWKNGGTVTLQTLWTTIFLWLPYKARNVTAKNVKYMIWFQTPLPAAISELKLTDVSRLSNHPHVVCILGHTCKLTSRKYGMIHFMPRKIAIQELFMNQCIVVASVHVHFAEVWFCSYLISIHNALKYKGMQTVLFRNRIE